MNSLLRNKFRDSDLDTAKIKAIDRVKGRVSLSMRNGLTSVGTYLYDIATLREGMNVLVGNVNGSYVILNEIQNIPRLGTSYSVRRPVIPVPPPVHDPNALLILNFEGEDGVTTWIEDAQGLSLGIYTEGASELDSSTYKFGSSCLETLNAGGNAYIHYTLPESIAGDFTGHGWIRVTGIAAWIASGMSYLSLISGWNDVGNSYFDFFHESGDRLYTMLKDKDGTVISWSGDYIHPITPYSEGVWAHFAIISSGSFVIFTIAGEVIRSFDTGKNNPLDGISSIYFGATFGTALRAAGGSVRYDAIEVVNYAKWTTFPFTPPTSPP